MIIIQKIRYVLFFVIVCRILSGFIQPVVAADIVPGTQTVVKYTVPDGAEYVVIDEMDGVQAKYRATSFYDTTGEYSCAGFVKNYFQKMYNVTVMNLFDLGPPQPVENFERVQVPQRGDLIFFPTPPNKNNHSAIVKAFDGKEITLIEQNVKWRDHSKNEDYTYINRRIPYPSSDYEIWRCKPAGTVSQPITTPTPGPTPTPIPAQTPSVTATPSPAPVNPELPVMDGDALFDAQPPVVVQPDPTQVIVPAPDPSLTPPVIIPVFDIEPIYDPANPSVPVFAQVSTVPVGNVNTSSVRLKIGEPYIDTDARRIEMDTTLFIHNGRTMVPIRWLSAALGIPEQNVDWDAATRIVSIYASEKVIRVQINSTDLYDNGVLVQMDTTAIIKDNRTFVPIRFIADAMGLTYAWDVQNRIATFYTSPQL